MHSLPLTRISEITRLCLSSTFSCGVAHNQVHQVVVVPGGGRILSINFQNHSLFFESLTLNVPCLRCQLQSFFYCTLMLPPTGIDGVKNVRHHLFILLQAARKLQSPTNASILYVIQELGTSKTFFTHVMLFIFQFESTSAFVEVGLTVHPLSPCSHQPLGVTPTDRKPPSVSLPVAYPSSWSDFCAVSPTETCFT